MAHKAPWGSILHWLANGETGSSSKVMAFCAAGIKCDCINEPLDPSDFNRCLMLVIAVPEVRDSFPEIARLSPEWKAIIEHWDELESLLISEFGPNGEKGLVARKTYERMVEIRKSARVESK